jgi:hypothetical protein
MLLGIMISPELDAVIKIYIVSTVIIVTVVVNVLARWTELYDKIIARIITDVYARLYKDELFRAFLEAKVKMIREKAHPARKGQ